MNRKEFLDVAEQIICRDRQDVHGKPEDCFHLIADYWGAFITNKCDTAVLLGAHDVAVMMALFKVARWQMNPNHKDNVVDGIGYLALAGELKSGDSYENPKL